jgi:hypothetical protein
MTAECDLCAKSFWITDLTIVNPEGELFCARCVEVSYGESFCLAEGNVEYE